MLFLMALVYLLLPSQTASSCSASIKTSFGLVHGQTTKGGVCAFLGIPFAEPPVRFAPAVDWTKDYPSGGWNATEPGKPCISTRQDGDESCLFLNVWSPRRCMRGNSSACATASSAEAARPSA